MDTIGILKVEFQNKKSFWNRVDLYNNKIQGKCPNPKKLEFVNNNKIFFVVSCATVWRGVRPLIRKKLWFALHP